MHRGFLLAGVILALCQTAAMAGSAMSFRSVRVELPTGDRIFPGGDKAEAINNNCLACHSAGMVLNPPPLTKAVWSAEVHKMINVYKAPVSQADADAVIAYLVQLKGKP